LGSNGSVVPLFTKQISRRTYHDNPSWYYSVFYDYSRSLPVGARSRSDG
jgi:hypothetical protein